MNNTTDEDAKAESRFWRWRNVRLVACCEAEMGYIIVQKIPELFEANKSNWCGNQQSMSTEEQSSVFFVS